MHFIWLQVTKCTTYVLSQLIQAKLLVFKVVYICSHFDFLRTTLHSLKLSIWKSRKTITWCTVTRGGLFCCSSLLRWECCRALLQTSARDFAVQVCACLGSLECVHPTRDISCARNGSINARQERRSKSIWWQTNRETSSETRSAQYEGGKELAETAYTPEPPSLVTVRPLTLVTPLLVLARVLMLMYRCSFHTYSLYLYPYSLANRSMLRYRNFTNASIIRCQFSLIYYN